VWNSLHGGDNTLYCHAYSWLEKGLGSVIGFINHLQVVTTTKYNTVTDFHNTNHSTLIYSVYFHQSSLSVSWQRIYNTLTLTKSSKHTLCLHRPSYNSSSGTNFWATTTQSSNSISGLSDTNTFSFYSLSSLSSVSQSYITTDGQSASLSWYQAPI
jgi:hypothetical protein